MVVSGYLILLTENHICLESLENKKLDFACFRILPEEVDKLDFHSSEIILDSHLNGAPFARLVHFVPGKFSKDHDLSQDLVLL